MESRCAISGTEVNWCRHVAGKRRRSFTTIEIALHLDTSVRPSASKRPVASPDHSQASSVRRSANWQTNPPPSYSPYPPPSAGLVRAAVPPRALSARTRRMRAVAPATAVSAIDQDESVVKNRHRHPAHRATHLPSLPFQHATNRLSSHIMYIGL